MNIKHSGHEHFDSILSWRSFYLKMNFDGIRKFNPLWWYVVLIATGQIAIMIDVAIMIDIRTCKI